MYEELAKILLTPDGERSSRSGELTVEQKETFIDDSLATIGKLNVVSNKFSECLESCEDIEVKSAIKIINTLYLSELKNAVNNNYCKTLTPIVMYALKKEQGILYEYWDKTDPAMDQLFRPWLWKRIKEVRDVHSDTVGVIRELILEGNPEREHKYVNTRGDWKLNLSDLILLQFWQASAELRNDSMILDFEDWDKMPALYAEPYKQHDNLGF